MPRISRAQSNALTRPVSKPTLQWLAPHILKEQKMHFNETVQQALRQVNALFPEVTQVFFGADGR